VAVESRLACLQDKLAKRKSNLVIRKDDVYTVRVSRKYDQYCPIAHALGLVGERWSLLVVRELLHGPLRYTDIAGRLPGCSTNMLAARLRALEEGGVIERDRLPPPAAAHVYRLTEYGQGLRPVMQALALWGARSLGPPTSEFNPDPGWLVGALDVALGPLVPEGSLEFRVDEEVASIVDGHGYDGPAEAPDVIVTCDAAGFYHLFMSRRFDCVEIEGDRDLVERLVAAVTPVPAAVPA
jgi:DNA-binding HxlR family transcriptional regulator